MIKIMMGYPDCNSFAHRNHFGRYWYLCDTHFIKTGKEIELHLDYDV